MFAIVENENLVEGLAKTKGFKKILKIKGSICCA
jgi:hypothetical protein